MTGDGGLLCVGHGFIIAAEDADNAVLPVSVGALPQVLRGVDPEHFVQAPTEPAVLQLLSVLQLGLSYPIPAI